ncbi:MAG: VTT domain-containing protein [Candidatus Azambacteria bacterium]|nr:VTT domain-containing protein [Candidatus Azambacteria bacterium]
MREILGFISHRKIASVAVLACLIVAFWFLTPLRDVFYDAVSLADAYVAQHQARGILVFIGLATISAMLSPFSSVPLIPIAIILWGNVWTIIFLVVGWLIGHAITYAIGYYAGHPVAKRFTGFEKIEHYSKKFSAKSEFLLVLLFRLAMPAEIPGYVLGTVRYNFVKYFIATLIAEFPFAIITVYASAALIDRKPVIMVSAIVGGIIFLAVAWYFFKKQIQHKTVDAAQSPW